MKYKVENKYIVDADSPEEALRVVKKLKDTLDTRKVINDGRRINYDDDVIKVTLNGKEIYKGIAEGWVNDDFYRDFKWTGSQYELSNAKGKWVVKVFDSMTDKKLKDALTATQEDILMEYAVKYRVKWKDIEDMLKEFIQQGMDTRAAVDEVINKIKAGK